MHGEKETCGIVTRKNVGKIYRISVMHVRTCTHKIQNIRKTCLCNEYSLKPHFYKVKLGYAGVYLFFLFLLQNIDCGYTLEPPRRGGSNEYPQSMFWSKNKKNIRNFLMKIFLFYNLKNLCILHGHVFIIISVMHVHTCTMSRQPYCYDMPHYQNLPV